MCTVRPKTSYRVQNEIFPSEFRLKDWYHECQKKKKNCDCDCDCDFKFQVRLIARFGRRLTPWRHRGPTITATTLAAPSTTSIMMINGIHGHTSDYWPSTESPALSGLPELWPGFDIWSPWTCTECPSVFLVPEGSLTKQYRDVKWALSRSWQKFRQLGLTSLLGLVSSQ